MPLLHRHLPQNLALLFGAHAPTTPSPSFASLLFQLFSLPSFSRERPTTVRDSMHIETFRLVATNGIPNVLLPDAEEGLSSAVLTNATDAHRWGEYGFFIRLMRCFRIQRAAWITRDSYGIGRGIVGDQSWFSCIYTCCVFAGF